jgi:hypothetical protein
MWRHVNADMPHHGIRDLLTDGGLALASTLLCNEEIAIHVGAYDIDVSVLVPVTPVFQLGHSFYEPPRLALAGPCRCQRFVGKRYEVLMLPLWPTTDAATASVTQRVRDCNEVG